jgi:hypothetical protein
MTRIQGIFADKQKVSREAFLQLFPSPKIRVNPLKSDFIRVLLHLILTYLAGSAQADSPMVTS